VDESIEDNGKVNISIVVYMRVEPVKHKDGDVMVHMEEGELSPLLSEYDEYSVPEVPNLRDIKQPKELSNRRVRLTVSDTRHDSVAITVSQKERLNSHVRA
jgi:hypothetical protein